MLRPVANSSCIPADSVFSLPVASSSVWCAACNINNSLRSAALLDSASISALLALSSRLSSSSFSTFRDAFTFDSISSKCEMQRCCSSIVTWLLFDSSRASKRDVLRSFSDAHAAPNCFSVSRNKSLSLSIWFESSDSLAEAVLIVDSMSSIRTVSIADCSRRVASADFRPSCVVSRSIQFAFSCLRFEVSSEVAACSRVNSTWHECNDDSTSFKSICKSCTHSLSLWTSSLSV